MNSDFQSLRYLAECSSLRTTGCLKVTSGKAQWRIYFRDGELSFADTCIGSLVHLRYFLLKNGWSEALHVLKLMPRSGEHHQTNGNNDLERGLAWLWEREGLTLAQMHQLLQDITQDAIESYLWLCEGKTAWTQEVKVPAYLLDIVGEDFILDLEDIVRYLKQRLRSWQACSETLYSPHARPYLLDFRDINRQVPNGNLSVDALEKLSGLMRKGLSLRQLSIYVKQDELHVAQLLSPYFDAKVMHLRRPVPPFDVLPPIARQAIAPKRDRKPGQQLYKVVCIDDSPTVLNEMERILGNSFQVTAIEDPVQAASSLFKLKPDLILMDITMPKINGYRLCGLLRNSSVFDQTPIIMVSSNTGLIDKARAKISGATDYLAKPFSQSSLMAIIQKHLLREASI